MSDPLCPQKRPYVLEEQPGVRAWCACGRSAAQPFCDGSHRGTGLFPVRAEIQNPGRVAWCGCKKTATPPFCDGTHARM